MLTPYSNIISVTTTSAFDADYLAVLNYATTQGYTLPSASQQLLQNQLVVDLKDGGIWSKLDTFAVFATDGDSDFALIDWIRLSDYTAVNSPTFTSNGGFQGNGTSAYIDTNFNPAIIGVNYTQDDAGRYFWVDNRGGSFYEGLASAAGNCTANQFTNAQRINQSSTSTVPSISMASDGFKSIHRTSSTNIEIFNDTSQSSAISTSSAVDSTNQMCFRRLSTFSSSRMKFYGMGASLVSENTDFYNAMNIYFTSI
jgi:hypothetical protein